MATLFQTLKNHARRESKLAGKGAYTDVSNRSLQVQLTKQEKIPSNSLLLEGIFAFAGFVSGLKARLLLQSGFVFYAQIGFQLSYSMGRPSA